MAKTWTRGDSSSTVLTVRVRKHWSRFKGKVVESQSLKVLSAWQGPKQPDLNSALTLFWAERGTTGPLRTFQPGGIRGSVSSGIMGDNWTSPHLRKTKHEEFLVCSHFVLIKKQLTWHRLFFYSYFEMSWILKEARLKTRFGWSSLPDCYQNLPLSFEHLGFHFSLRNNSSPI